ncbi:MAG: PepSY-like domain-containing protein [Bacteroidetes bacterium]|nr:PepSY-like domain-containing protein [Bacteroidota bacterium]
MKTIFIMLFTVVICNNTTMAQNTPQAVKDAFKKAYSGATKVKWDKEEAQYEATFHYKNQEMSVLYNADGSLAETETEISADALPAKAKQYASSKGKIKGAAKIVAPNGTTQYEAEMKSKDLIFDDQGNFIKEKQEKEGYKD